jgi:hypothetical protein
VGQGREWLDFPCRMEMSPGKHLLKQGETVIFSFILFDNLCSVSDMIPT